MICLGCTSDSLSAENILSPMVDFHTDTKRAFAYANICSRKLISMMMMMEQTDEEEVDKSQKKHERGKQRSTIEICKAITSYGCHRDNAYKRHSPRVHCYHHLV